MVWCPCHKSNNGLMIFMNPVDVGTSVHEHGALDITHFQSLRTTVIVDGVHDARRKESHWGDLADGRVNISNWIRTRA